MTEEKEWMTLEETAQYVGVKRATVYNYMKDLLVTSKKFGRDRRAYIALADVKRMKEYKERPWSITEEDTGERPAATKPKKEAA